MPKICYTPKKFTPAHKRVIELANQILEEYTQQGFPWMTLRQLYYRFVSRDIFPNNLKSYNYLKGIVGEGRLAGLIDWHYLEDRTRNLATLQHFNGPQDALDKLKGWYHVDMWAEQEWRPEVWIEKDALVGVIQDVCEENDIPYFSCRGYTSLSEMWRAANRLTRWMDNNQKPYIIHLGDHDPSGIDMSRDIYERLHQTFMADCDFNRVALTMDQIEEYSPPPNPAKVTDSRYETYVSKYGDESWELDSLEPMKFRELIELELGKLRDQSQWGIDVAEEGRVKKQLQEIATDWEGIPKNKRLVREQEKKLTDLAGQLRKANGQIAKLKNKGK